ncbi:hypothetical protein EDB86DRAFT_783997 [Lactarius hatsudake]|nr:hypothetical protein EDB86DRAFT_783997 [Lactarius hatsudake]
MGRRRDVKWLRLLAGSQLRGGRVWLGKREVVLGRVVCSDAMPRREWAMCMRGDVASQGKGYDETGGDIESREETSWSLPWATRDQVEAGLGTVVGGSSSHKRAEMETRTGRHCIDGTKKEYKDENENGNVQRDIATQPTQRSRTTAVGNNHTFPLPRKRVGRTQVPSFTTSRFSCSPAYMTVSRSSTHSSPATGGRIIVEMLFRG